MNECTGMRRPTSPGHAQPVDEQIQAILHGGASLNQTQYPIVILIGGLFQSGFTRSARHMVGAA
jgi:hypothetical protein